MNLSTPDSILSSNTVDTIKSLINFIFTFLGDVFSSIEGFYDMLEKTNGQLNDMILAAEKGSVFNVPLYQIIGAYRYLVTDPIFYLTYVMVALGCGFTIYKLVKFLVDKLKEFMCSLVPGTDLKLSTVIKELMKRF